MIWVLSGTSDGNHIVSLIKNAGHEVLATAVTPYGSKLAREAGADIVAKKALESSEMIDLIKDHRIERVVDATHPFASQASLNSMAACRATKTPYIRYERPPSRLPDHPLIHVAAGFEEAFDKAVELGNIVFYTCGAKNLESFIRKAHSCGKRALISVHTETDGLERCVELGIPAEDVVSVGRGPTQDVFKSLLRECCADVILTKESGESGWTSAKVLAGLDLGIPSVIVRRPHVRYERVVYEYEDVMKFLNG